MFQNNSSNDRSNEDTTFDESGAIGETNAVVAAGFKTALSNRRGGKSFDKNRSISNRGEGTFRNDNFRSIGLNQNSILTALDFERIDFAIAPIFGDDCGESRIFANIFGDCEVCLRNKFEKLNGDSVFEKFVVRDDARTIGASDCHRDVVVGEFVFFDISTSVVLNHDSLLFVAKCVEMEDWRAPL